MIVFIAAELAEALSYAHARRLPDGTSMGIVHRDVMPANVLLSYDGVMKLADFGIAKVRHGERTRTGVTEGKAPYMAPEQSLGDVLDGRVARRDLRATDQESAQVLGEQVVRGELGQWLSKSLYGVSSTVAT